MDSQEDVKEMEANCTLELGPPSSSSFASAYSFQSSVKPEQHSQEESRMKIDLDLDMISLSWHQALHDQTSQFSPTLSSNLTPAQDSESHLHQFHNNYSEHHDIQFQDYLSMDRDRYDISNRPQHQSQQQLGFGYSWVAEELKSREDVEKQGLGSLVWFRATSPSDNDLQKNFDMSYSSPKNMARVCVDCKTTKTPLWRSGPQGPKSLCNACGIRYRKARRALAAAALGNPTDISPSKPASFKRKPHDNTSEKKKKKLHNNVASSSSNSWKKKAHSHTASASTSTAPFNRVFARDEEEAAVLLMALSCGLVHV